MPKPACLWGCLEWALLETTGEADKSPIKEIEMDEKRKRNYWRGVFQKIRNAQGEDYYVEAEAAENHIIDLEKSHWLQVRALENYENEMISKDTLLQQGREIIEAGMRGERPKEKLRAWLRAVNDE